MIMLKRKNGELREFINAEYLPAYYLIPKEIIDRNPKKLREIPRMFAMLTLDEEAIATVESDLFILLIIDAYAYMVWQFIKPYEYMEIYSGFDPLWRFVHNVDVWLMALKEAHYLFDVKRLTERPYVVLDYVSLEQMTAALMHIVPKVMRENKMYEVMEIVENHRCFEDFDYRSSNRKTDFYRQWYHTRTKHPQISLDAFMEEYEQTHGGRKWEIVDESIEVESSVVSSGYVQGFLDTLSPEDRRIVELRMKELTLEQIAKEVGYKTHSAVLKRLKRIGEKYRKYENES